MFIVADLVSLTILKYVNLDERHLVTEAIILMKCHKNTLQTNPTYREDEQKNKNNHKTPERSTRNI